MCAPFYLVRNDARVPRGHRDATFIKSSELHLALTQCRAAILCCCSYLSHDYLSFRVESARQQTFQMSRGGAIGLTRIVEIDLDGSWAVWIRCCLRVFYSPLVALNQRTEARLLHLIDCRSWSVRPEFEKISRIQPCSRLDRAGRDVAENLSRTVCADR